MKKSIIIFIIAIAVIGSAAGYFALVRKPAPPSCDQWMGNNFQLAEYRTDEAILRACDRKTFKVLDHEYAKDKSFVYYKPMPNASNMTVVVKNADSKSFKLHKRCSGYAVDKTYVYRNGTVVKGKNPVIFQKYDSDNPETYCS